ncbi:hypothetical protein HKD37_07G019797 [Glycine soja]
MTSHSHYPPDLDADSVSSSPRSDHFHDAPPRVRFMCSFGGKILPRPHDNQLRYVGGDTRIVAVPRSITFSALILKLSKLSGMSNITAKYQLPNEELDALISVTTDEDVENMMDEYDRVTHNQNPRSARLRLFLFPEGEDSRANSIGSLLNGSANRENWFLDALNGGVSGLERGRSEASSMVSEVPDYLFGLDNSEEITNHQHQRDPRPKPVLQDSVSVTDPGSPAPVVSSPYCSTSSAPHVPSLPNLPHVKTKPLNLNPVPDTHFKENQPEPETEPQPNLYLNPNNPVIHYPPEAAYSVNPVPVFYVSGPVRPGTVPVPMQTPYPYVQQPYHAVMPPQVPIGYHHLVPGSGQLYGAGVRHVTPLQPYSPSAAVVHDGLKQHGYHPVPNTGSVPVHPVTPMTGSVEPQRGGAEFVAGRGPSSLNN